MRQWIADALHLLRVAADFATVYASFYLGYQLYFLGKPQEWSVWLPELRPDLYYLPVERNHFLTVALGVSLMTVLVYAAKGLYRDDTSVLHVREYRSVMSGFVIACLLFLALYYIYFAYLGPRIREKLFSRRIFSYASAFSLAGILAVRVTINRIQHRLHRRGIGARRVLIYGAGATGRLVARRLSEFPAFSLLAAGFVDDDETLAGTTVVFDQARGYSLPVLGTGSHLEELMRSAGATEVLVALPSKTPEQNMQVMNYCRGRGIRFRFVPHVYEMAVQRTVMQDLAGIPVIALREPSHRYVYLFCKRLADVVLSAAALVVLSPLFLAIALVIRMRSPGPALFVQERVGLGGKTFRMLKFRTMYVDADPYAVTPKSQHDRRITPFGRWLRRTSLDELPQLVNVLAGSMSLVGPRPEMPFIVATYDDLHRERLRVKPGITGLWQISADRRVAIHENMDYDLYYLHEQSLLLDVVILVQTVFLAFRGI